MAIRHEVFGPDPYKRPFPQDRMEIGEKRAEEVFEAKIEEVIGGMGSRTPNPKVLFALKDGDEGYIPLEGDKGFRVLKHNLQEIVMKIMEGYGLKPNEYDEEISFLPSSGVTRQQRTYPTELPGLKFVRWLDFIGSEDNPTFLYWEVREDRIVKVKNR